jgi:hypothetical protein
VFAASIVVLALILGFSASCVQPTASVDTTKPINSVRNNLNNYFNIQVNGVLKQERL